MRASGCLIAHHASTCFVARTTGAGPEVRELPIESPEEVEDMASASAEALRQRGCAGAEVCLGVPSEMVLAAEMETGGLPRRVRRSGMAFRLEEQLPIDAESFTADFVPTSAGRALGLAVETRRVQTILDALTNHGVEVAVACPTAFLAAWALCQHVDAPGHYVVIHLSGQTDVLRLTQGAPAAWYTVEAADGDGVIRCIRADLLLSPVETDSPVVRVIGRASAELEERLKGETDLRIELGEDGPLELAAQAAGAALAGRGGGWVNFRRDALAVPNPWGQAAGLLRACAVLAILLLAAVIGMALWRGARYDAVIARCYGEQIVEFHKLYPNRAAPPGIRLYLEGEAKRLAGASGLGHDVPARPNALSTLRRVVSALPRDVRLRLTEVTCGPAGIFLQGEATSFAHAEAVARGLRAAGFDVDPPRSERSRERGVLFSVAARLPASSPSSPESAEGTP